MARTVLHELFFEPVVGEWLVVERLHLDPAGGVVEGQGFAKDGAGLDVRDACAARLGARLQRVEQPPAEPESPCLWCDPHALDLSRRVGMMLDRATADGLVMQVGDKELAGGRPDLMRQRSRADCGIEATSR